MYAKCGQHMQAIELWRSLLTSHPPEQTNQYITTTVLTSCAQLATTYALSQGSYIHSLVHSRVLQPDVQLFTALMNMYVKCKQPEQALEVWADLERAGKSITSHITCVCVLAACASVGTLAALEIGKRAHAYQL